MMVKPAGVSQFVGSRVSNRVRQGYPRFEFEFYLESFHIDSCHVVVRVVIPAAVDGVVNDQRWSNLVLCRDANGRIEQGIPSEMGAFPICDSL